MDTKQLPKVEFADARWIENSNPHPRADRQYLQVRTSETDIYLFTEEDLTKAKARAESNSYDLAGTRFFMKWILKYIFSFR